MKKCKYGYAPDGDSTIDGQIEIPTKVNDDDITRGTRCANTFDDSSIPGYSTTDFTNAANEMQQAIAGSRDKQEVEHVPYENFKGLKTEIERVINFSDDALVDRIYSDLFKILYAKPESYDMIRELVISLETIFDKYLLLPVNDRRSSSLKNYIITCEKLCESKTEPTEKSKETETESESRYDPNIGKFLTEGMSKARTLNDLKRDLNSVYGLNCGLLNDSDINVFSTAGLACDSSSPLDSKLKESKKILEFIKECLRQHLTFDEAKEILRMTDVM